MPIRLHEDDKAPAFAAFCIVVDASNWDKGKIFQEMVYVCGESENDIVIKVLDV